MEDLLARLEVLLRPPPSSRPASAPRAQAAAIGRASTSSRPSAADPTRASSSGRSFARATKRGIRRRGDRGSPRPRSDARASPSCRVPRRRRRSGSPPRIAATMLCAALFAWRIACWAVGGEKPPSGAGTCAQSPSAHTSSRPSTRRKRSTISRPFFVFGSAERLDQRMGRARYGGHERSGGNALAARQHGLFAGRRLEPGVETDLDAPTCEDPLRKQRELLGDLRQDAVLRMDEHDADLVRIEAAVAPCHAAHEVVELRRDLHARRSRRRRPRT